MKTTKIVIAGIGGVGGYFGALMARTYATSPIIDICFFARGQNLAQINKHGLTLTTRGDTLLAKPDLATDDATEIGIADYVIICTKNYDLAAIVNQLHPCIGEETVILPLLNGVEARPKIKALLPDADVLFGCTYLVSTIKSAGVIEETGNKRQIYFGLPEVKDERLTNLEKIFRNAGIDATASTDILSIIWEKFIFLSALATATSYFNQSVGQLLDEHQADLAEFVREVAEIARAKKVNLSADPIGKSLSHYQSLPYDATSSMHRDFLQPHHQTELDSLTGYVVAEGEKLNVHTPNFAKALIHLRQKAR